MQHVCIIHIDVAWAIHSIRLLRWQRSIEHCGDGGGGVGGGG